MGYKRRKKSIGISAYLNFLSANPTKWSNTVKQFLGSLPTNCLSLFDHFVKLALKGLRVSQNIFCLSLSVCLSVWLPASLYLSLCLSLSLKGRKMWINPILLLLFYCFVGDVHVNCLFVCVVCIFFTVFFELWSPSFLFCLLNYEYILSSLIFSYLELCRPTYL